MILMRIAMISLGLFSMLDAHATEKCNIPGIAENAPQDLICFFNDSKNNHVYEVNLDCLHIKGKEHPEYRIIMKRDDVLMGPAYFPKASSQVNSNKALQLDFNFEQSSYLSLVHIDFYGFEGGYNALLNNQNSGLNLTGKCQ